VYKCRDGLAPGYLAQHCVLLSASLLPLISAFCWRFPAPGAALEHCQVRLTAVTGFPLLRPRCLKSSTSPSLFCHLCLSTASGNILRHFFFFLASLGSPLQAPLRRVSLIVASAKWLFTFFNHPQVITIPHELSNVAIISRAVCLTQMPSGCTDANLIYSTCALELVMSSSNVSSPWTADYACSLRETWETN